MNHNVVTGLCSEASPSSEESKVHKNVGIDECEPSSMVENSPILVEEHQPINNHNTITYRKSDSGAGWLPPAHLCNRPA